MKVLLLISMAFYGSIALCQKPVLQLSSVVKDSLGGVYPADTWQSLLMTGAYETKPENPNDINTAFLLLRLSDEALKKKLARMPRPPKSKVFKTGQKFNGFEARDVQGNLLNLKETAGKVVVLNFWFINCPPCRAETPQLNALVDSFQNNNNVVFVAVALDEPARVKDYLAIHPFKYRIVEDGRPIAEGYGIDGYPTNVVIDTEGKVYFHTSGLAANTVQWMKRSITDCLAKRP